MFLVEDSRLASPTQLAAIQRRKAFFDLLETRAVKSPPSQVICAENKIEPTMDKPQNKQSSLEKPKPSVITYDATIFASHVANVIVHICGKHYKVGRGEIMGSCRYARIVLARQVTYYVAKKVTKWSYPEIGRRLGFKDHATIISGLKKIERLRKQSTEFSAELDELVSIARSRLEGCASLAVPAIGEQHVPEQQGEGAGTGAFA